MLMELLAALPSAHSLLLALAIMGLLLLLVWSLVSSLARRNDSGINAMLAKAERELAHRHRLEPGSGHTECVPLRTTNGGERVVAIRRVKAGTGDGR